MRACLIPCLALLQVACAVRMPPVPVRSFTDGDLDRVQQFAAKQVKEGPEENLALVLNIQAQCELLRGDLQAVEAQVLGGLDGHGHGDSPHRILD